MAFSGSETDIDTTTIDGQFLDSVIAAADTKTSELLNDTGNSDPENNDAGNADTAQLPHRTLASRIKLLVACYLVPGSQHHESAQAIDLASQLASYLTAQQGTSGLFIGGDNVNSPPDSAFSLNDLADADALLAQISPATAEVTALRAHLKTIADTAKPALLVGGVHTPNHRWEISAALARFHRTWPDTALRTRAEEWLAEGIDIDADGFYSERSPNYAAYVSNPALLVLGDVFNLPELHALVERNLELTLDLIRPDGTVETLQSRRQDQNDSYPLAPYLLPFRRLAIERGRSDFAWAAQESVRHGIADPETVLADILLHPQIARRMPDATPPVSTRRRHVPGVALAIDSSDQRTLVTYGGSDYSSFRMIRSGLANNPTFARLFAGNAVLESIRLSRDFFGLGPFRAESFEPVSEPGAEPGEAPQYRLTETISASYFQPMSPAQRSTDGVYALSDDGRFSASMAFGERDTDTVTLVTSVVVRPTEAGADIEFTFDGPDVAWALELTFQPGGTLEGTRTLSDTDAHLVSGTGQYRVGNDVIRFGPGNGASLDTPPVYRPGQDYSFLGGTDATSGRHVYITGRSPGTYVLHLAAERSAQS
ncbi:hypothetical protein ACLRGF_11965 [Mycetocola zhadangensis]|uniref:hypothetical protein n=1 Tax=Mycetocola zhadangensis TaxID=1164595 RepID=UPI003A4D2138